MQHLWSSLSSSSVLLFGLKASPGAPFILGMNERATLVPPSNPALDSERPTLPPPSDDAQFELEIDCMFEADGTQ